MSKIATAGIAIVVVLTSAVLGFRFGSGAWPHLRAQPEVAPAAATRSILYWKHPDGGADFSPTPKKTADGRDFRPVYEDQEADFKVAGAPKNVSRKIIYYRNPMGLPDTSPVPKKDWMGMDYIPVYEGEENDGSTVRVSLDRVQRSGVRTQAAEMRSMARPVFAPGIAKLDERTLRTVTLRADGFIEKLYVNETGKHVRAGEPLFRVYSPLMVSAQVDYRTAGSSLGALQRLRNFDIPEAVIQQLKASSTPSMSIDWPAPVTGVVMQKKVIEGQMVRAGEEIFRLADLDTIWVIADVNEQDVGLVNIGAHTNVRFRAFPDRPVDGYVAFVLHELDAATRTAKVRIEVKNLDHRIKHEMYADVEIDSGSGDAHRLVVPASAVIDSGSRQVVIVDRGEGRFEPRAVKLGLRGDGLIEVRDGIKAGEMVVVAANFLIDAESNLKAALSGFKAEPKQ
jgi:Cu(I)/Ag(I) efflux system membrane fusion protein